MKKNIYQEIETQKVIPIIRENTFTLAQEKLDLAIELGFKVIEITYTIPNAGKLITYAHQKNADLVIGAGTVLKISQLKDAMACQADFIVSPHFSTQVGKQCLEKEIPYIPGSLTPTEIINAYLQGFPMIKIFPAKAFDPMLFKAIKSILPELKIMATGGIEIAKIKQWQKYPINVFGLGSDLFAGTKPEIIKKIKQLKEDFNGYQK